MLRLVAAEWKVEATDVVCADLSVVGDVVEGWGAEAEAVVRAYVNLRAALRRNVDIVGLSGDIDLEPEAVFGAAGVGHGVDGSGSGAVVGVDEAGRVEAHDGGEAVIGEL